MYYNSISETNINNFNFENKLNQRLYTFQQLLIEFKICIYRN